MLSIFCTIFYFFFLMIRRPPKSTLFPYTPLFLFFFNDTATTEIYTLSLHDALPICRFSLQKATLGAIIRKQIVKGMACHTPRGCALASRYKTLWGGRNRTNWAWHVVRLFVVLDQGEDVEAAQLLAAVEESELDGEGGAFDCTPELLDEFGGGGGGATGGEQVIANDHALAGLDGVFVDFERVCAVFQGIGHARGFGGGGFFRLH